MKALIVILLVVIVISIITTHKSSFEKNSRLFEPTTTIADIKTKQSIFSDSLITLHDVRIKKCESILSYSKSLITDDSNEEIVLLSNKPFIKGEIADITGRIFVIFQKDSTVILFFVDNRLKPITDLTRLIRAAI